MPRLRVPRTTTRTTITASIMAKMKLQISVATMVQTGQTGFGRCASTPKPQKKTNGNSQTDRRTGSDPRIDRPSKPGATEAFSREMKRQWDENTNNSYIYIEEVLNEREKAVGEEESMRIMICDPRHCSHVRTAMQAK